MMRIIFVVFNRMGLPLGLVSGRLRSMLLSASRIIQLIFAYSQNAAHGAKDFERLASHAEGPAR